VYATGAKDFGSAATKADTLGADILVVVGRDWKTLTHHLTNLPGTKRVTPATSSTTTTTTTTKPPPTTTSTVDRRFIPVDPKTGGVLVGCPKH
jgi:hypothetical protein